MFKCEFCNREYDLPIERSRCVLNCYKAEKEKEEIQAKAALRKQKNESRNLIREKANELQNLIEEHNKKFAEDINGFSYYQPPIRSSLMPNGFPSFEFLGLT